MSTGFLSGLRSLPIRRRWRCMFVYEVERVAAADPASAWGTADNYNPAQPFHVIDEVTVAVTAAYPLQAG